jgi:hypothetical protein
MPEHKVGTREDWRPARDELAKLEAAGAERNEGIKRKRLELPWVPVEKEYGFNTEDGKESLAELFEGRSQPNAQFGSAVGFVCKEHIGTFTFTSALPFSRTGQGAPGVALAREVSPHEQ